jgi:flagellar protein FlgJ
MGNTDIVSGMPAGLPPAGSQPRTLREAAREFESLFVAQVVKAMRSTVPDGGFLGSSGGERIFREMLDQELSREIAFAGGFGIGDVLCRQLDASAAVRHTQGSEFDENR